MKNTILALSLTLVIFSCKKDDTESDFTATDVNGTSNVTGTLQKPVLVKTGTTTNVTSELAPATGIPITISVNKSALYPNSTSQGADVYHGTTDAFGNYLITVKSNANGVPARFSIDGFPGTIDTIVNGVPKTGRYHFFEGITTTSLVLYMGHNTQVNYTFQ
jgi:hypothetical protein